MPSGEAMRAAPADQAARAAAIDTGCSVLVEAPAGAGKTNLLTQRFLALLAEVEEPEQILAITFTRAAAAEMRNRILGALAAAKMQPAALAGEGAEMPLARRARAHAEAMGWNLEEQPHRLSVETIDSLCRELAHGQPLLARLGGRLAPSERPEAMYRIAARRTLALLGDPDAGDVESAVRALLRRRDNGLPGLERMLAEMLAGRAEWLGLFPLGAVDEEELEALRAELEAVFAREHARLLDQLCALAAGMGPVAEEWRALARIGAWVLDAEPEGYAVHRLREPIDAQEMDVPCWRALSFFVLTSGDKPGWRKRYTKAEGFPAQTEGKDAATKARLKDAKARMERCCADLQAHPQSGEMLDALCALRSLPPLHYTEAQWETLCAAFTVLRRAVGELRLVFAERDAVDFVEIAAAAEQVLHDPETLRGLVESERRRHLLIDEFQDTSRSQFRLVEGLLREWQPGDGRTVFVVGDPLQSIYSFRQAEVALFRETKAHGLPCGNGRRHLCEPLHLTHNFRSHQALVDRLNAWFERMFDDGGGDHFVESTAWPGEVQGPFVTVHAQFVDKAEGDTPQQARMGEAAKLVQVLGEELPLIEAAKARGAGEYRVAVLVRGRRHLGAILPALHAAGIPFRAVDLEPLPDRPEVFDLLMLLRALLHAGDRVAWLSVLRAPWIGLSLRDLHVIAGEDDSSLLTRPIPELLASRNLTADEALSENGRRRLGRAWPVLQAALSSRYADGNGLSLATWVERTWLALGGAACVQGAQRDNVETFLGLLDTLAPSGEEVLQGDFDLRLADLCAQPDATVNERFGVQVMTMHKAKGLGFEVVLLPGLERGAPADGAALLHRLVRQRADEPERTELLLAPVDDSDASEPDPLQRWVRGERAKRDAEERKRLFYVACTRARLRLHLLATATVAKDTLRRPIAGSLLQAAWPALEDELQQAFARRGAAPLALAAAAETTPIAEAASGTHVLERLPADWFPKAWLPEIATRAVTRREGAPFVRSGSAAPAARLRGTVLHALMEHLGDAGANTAAPDGLQARLERLASRGLREGGWTAAAAAAEAQALTAIALRVLEDPDGRWLLGERDSALAESGWQAVDPAGAAYTLRVDRSFLGGPEPGADGDAYRWIIDYKTGRPSADADVEPWLADQRVGWEAQLHAYGAVIAGSENIEADRLRYGLYFPEVQRLVWWSAQESTAPVAT